MVTVERYITENNKRISHVKSLVKEKADELILIPESRRLLCQKGFLGKT